MLLTSGHALETLVKDGRIREGSIVLTKPCTGASHAEERRAAQSFVGLDVPMSGPCQNVGKNVRSQAAPHMRNFARKQF